MKPTQIIKGSIAAAVILGIAGCGGSGGGIAVSHKLVVETDATGIAYKIATVPWSKEMENTENMGGKFKRYTIDIEGKYNVILSCNSHSTTVLFASTTTEDPLFHYQCPKITASALKSFTGNISDQTSSPDEYYIAMRDSSMGMAASNTSYKLDKVKVSEHNDLASFNIKKIGGEMIPQRFYIQRDIDMTKTLSHHINFTLNNSVTIEGNSMSTAPKTAGSVYLITENNTNIIMSHKNRWYYPTGSLEESDIYLKISYNWNGMIKQEAITATKIQKNNILMDISYFNPLTQITYNNSHLGGLNLYKTDPKNEVFRGYYFQLDNGTKNYDLITSKAYLEDDSDFILPPLPTLAEFNNNWDGANASDVMAYAVMCDFNLSEFWKNGRNSKVTDIPFINNHTVETVSQLVK